MIVSFAVVAYNEAETLPRLLRDLAGQDYPHEKVEVLLIDSMSTDDTARIMEDFSVSQIGETLDILCEAYDEDSGLCIGRSWADSPDIDGLVYFTGRCPEGEMTDVLISGADDGMLIGDEI